MRSSPQKPVRDGIIVQIEAELLENDSFAKANLSHFDNNTTAVAEDLLDFLVNGTPSMNLKSNIRRTFCPGFKRDTPVLAPNTRQSISYLRERKYNAFRYIWNTAALYYQSIL